MSSERPDAETTIQMYPDGPLIVRGNFSVQDHHGRDIANERRTVALCRCGRSGLKPFCDGSHKRMGRALGGDGASASAP